MRIKYNSPVVLTFALICAVTLGVNYLTAGMSNTLLFCTYRGSLFNPFTYVRMFTFVFGHSDLSHYVGNMMLFMLLGPMIEEKYGSKKLMFIIAVSAVMTAAANMLLSDTALLGASGIVFTSVILSSMTAFDAKEIPLTMIVVAIMYIGKEVLNGVFTADNISQMAHIIGGIAGGMCGYMLKPKINS